VISLGSDFFTYHITGEVLENFDLVKEMERQGSASGNPAKEVKITASGTC